MTIDLKFIKSWGSYNAGEAARFTHEVAEVLVRKGIAIEHRIEAALETVVDAAKSVTGAAKTDDKSKAASK